MDTVAHTILRELDRVFIVFSAIAAGLVSSAAILLMHGIFTQRA